MSDLQLRYKKALEFVKNSPAGEVEMSNQLKLQFYAIFKQATDGECKGSAPSRLKIIERAKYDAWKALGKMTKDVAMQKYIDEVTKLAPKWESVKPKL